MQIELLEWADDLEMHHLKGYGETLNYRMGVPLLDDVVKSMDRAMAADREFPEQITFEFLEVNRNSSLFRTKDVRDLLWLLGK